MSGNPSRCPDQSITPSNSAIKNDFADLISFDRAPSLLPRSSATGKRLHRGCLYKWAKHGQCGVRLKSIKVNGVWHTKASWLMEYFEQVTAAQQAGGGDVLRCRSGV